MQSHRFRGGGGKEWKEWQEAQQSGGQFSNRPPICLHSDRPQVSTWGNFDGGSDSLGRSGSETSILPSGLPYRLKLTLSWPSVCGTHNA
ncbi:hypothetical protein Pla22_04900 [Rubripirellula amarantea]|uniref:Uncharacterized protein n=1 Tax=Rubripirellula amarantea TaxID=2527999 RepID=A0A5C5WSS5_9BACT|nr:hypothetical protein Pla22_04900 [Rubripirellula amarantea]